MLQLIGHGNVRCAGGCCSAVLLLCAVGATTTERARFCCAVVSWTVLHTAVQSCGRASFAQHLSTEQYDGETGQGSDSSWLACTGWFLFFFLSFLLPWTTFPSFAFGCATWARASGSLSHRGGECLGGEGDGNCRGLENCLLCILGRWITGGNDAVTRETGSVVVSTADGQ